MHQKTKHLEVTIEMERSLVELDDLPDEILLTIFQKLDNISLLNALMHVNRRPNAIVCDSIFKIGFSFKMTYTFIICQVNSNLHFLKSIRITSSYIPC